MQGDLVNHATAEVSNMGCRVTMERIGQLEPRISVLEDDFDEEALEAEAGDAEAAAVSISPGFRHGAYGTLPKPLTQLLALWSHY